MTRDDRKSTTGYLFKLKGPGGAISWEVREQQKTALSTSEAEYQSLAAACQVELILRSLLEDLGYKQNASTSIQEDNQSCIKIAENPVLARRNKHIERKHHFVRHVFKHEVIKLLYCSRGPRGRSSYGAPRPRKSSETSETNSGTS